MRAKPRKRVKKICLFCNEKFEVKYSHAEKKRFCTPQCYRNWLCTRKATLICKFCGKEFIVKYSQAKKAKFCCMKCQRDWQRSKRVKEACSFCGKELELTAFHIRKMNTQGHFCSSKCRGAWLSENWRGDKHPGWKGGTVKAKCPICERVFETKPSVLKRTEVNCCSPKCRGIRRTLLRTKSVVCAVCGKEFTAAKSKDRIYCSKKCWGKYLSEIQQGSNSHHWQGGIAYEPYPPEFNGRCRRSIRERDGYVCQICSKSNSKHVHHVDYIKDNIEPLNLVTLCVSCHSATNSNREYWTERLQRLMNHE